MTKKLGRGLGMATLVLALVGVPALSAYADSGGGCYPSCPPPTTQTSTGGGGGSTTGSGGSGGNSGSGTLPPVTKSSGGSGSSGTESAGTGTGATTVSTKSAGGSLPFTGADIEEMTIGGVLALLIGGVLLRRSRSRRRASV